MPPTTQFAQAVPQSRTRGIAFVALSIAIMAVGSWVTVPFGPIPFTLQNFAFPFVIAVLSPKQAVAAIAGYLVLGAIGVPVFSGMRGGFGMLLGPTGGFLWGYLFGGIAAALFLTAVRKRKGRRTGATAASRTAQAHDPSQAARQSAGAKVARFFRVCGIDFVAGVIFTAVSYVGGWLQYMALMQVGPEVAFLTCCAPFIVLDLIKIAAAAVCAQPVKAAIAQ